ncbi:hypothetical protein BDQ17DRAFT_223769 [Cyathus striatus]|nr:hypothetical protein BDQ17DRAFT_223769 [Cyathus striatus]
MLLRPLKSSATRCWRTRISSFANFTRETHEIAPLRRPGLGISTFDPSRISPDDHMDLSNRYRRNVKLLSFGQQKAIMKMPYSHISGVRLPQPYPPNTKGFLVFHSPYPTKHLNSPMYNRPNTHLPWSIPLFDIVNYKCYRFVGEQLLKDGLVTPSLLTRIRRIYENINLSRELLLFAQLVNHGCLIFHKDGSIYLCWVMEGLSIVACRGIHVLSIRRLLLTLNEL